MRTFITPATAWYPGDPEALRRNWAKGYQLAFEYVARFKVYYPQVGDAPQLNGRTCLIHPTKRG